VGVCGQWPPHPRLRSQRTATTAAACLAKCGPKAIHAGTAHNRALVADRSKAVCVCVCVWFSVWAPLHNQRCFCAVARISPPPLQLLAPVAAAARSKGESLASRILIREGNEAVTEARRAPTAQPTQLTQERPQDTFPRCFQLSTATRNVPLSADGKMK
jgi:hypothetical protein